MLFKKTALSCALTLSLAGAAVAQPDVLAFNDQIEIGGLNSAYTYQLEIKLPNGQVKSMPVLKAEVFALTAQDLGMGALADGQYKYQITQNALIKQDRSANSKPSNNSKSYAGVFSIKGGQFVNDQDEGGATEDQQILDDLIVDGSLCVGMDCVNGESFGFDTIRLKENNLRIKFQDTSNSASFPSNDWQITINDSSNGGANKFAIDDIDGGRTPFTIEAGAPSHSLYVDNGGRIGIGTANPVVENHIVNGDSPTVRLEQNGSNGWTPQTWDLAGNETNFFIRDVTNGSQLPFSIRPNSPSRSIDIHPDGIEFLNNTSVLDNDNRLGIGTNDPQNNLHLVETTGNAGIQLENSSSGTSWKFVNKGNAFQVSKVGATGSQFKIYDSGAADIGDNGASTNFAMDSSGNVTIQGALTQNSDVHTKENIKLVNTTEILNKVMELPISVWNYKFDDDEIRHLGPMAQDFFQKFNLGHSETKIATIDTSGVALASIKELGKQLKNKDSEIKSLKAENNELKSRLETIEEKLKNL